MGIVQLIIQVVLGAIGGNIAGAAMKDKSLGALGNTIAGVVGGGVGGQILNAIVGGDPAAGMTIGNIIQQIVGGGVGGAILLIVVALIKGGTSKA